MRIVNYYRDAGRASGVTHALVALQAAAATRFDTMTLRAGSEYSDNPVAAAGLPEMVVPHVGRGRQLSVPTTLPIDAGDLLVLHEGWVTSNYVAAAYARKKDVPYVVVPHGVYESGLVKSIKLRIARQVALERKYLASAAAVHVLAAGEAESVQSVAPNAAVFSCPVSLAPLPEVFDTGHKPRSYIAWYGRYAPMHKGLDRLLQSYACIPASSRLPLVLRGPDYRQGRASVEALVSALGLQHQVSVGSELKDDTAKAGFLADAAAFVFPSRWESFGLALLEALSSGVPCVVSDQIDLAPELAQRDACQLVDFDDPVAAACAIESVSLRRASFRDARTFVCDAFSPNTVAEHYTNCLASVIDARGQE